MDSLGHLSDNADMSRIRVNFRMTEEESARFREILKRAEEAGYSDVTKVVKELMGMKPWKLLRERDREYLVKTQPPPKSRSNPGSEKVRKISAG